MRIPYSSISLLTLLTAFQLLSPPIPVQATHGALEDCYACSLKDSGNRYICNWGDRFSGKVACCTQGNKSPYCQDTPTYNKCSRPYNQMQDLFFNYCPSAKLDLCGELELYPKKEKVTVSLEDKMKTKKDACYYVIKKKDNMTYGVGDMFIRISQIDNLAVSLHQGTSATDLDAKNLVKKNHLASAGETYKLQNTGQIIVSVHIPKNVADGTSTKFSFDYWTDAKEADLGQQFEAWLESIGGLKWFFLGCCACVGVLILCCFGVCIQQLCCKEKKVHHGLPETEFSTNQEQLHMYGQNQHAVELVVESMGKSEDTNSAADKDFDIRSYHGIQKEDKSARQNEINFQHTNPFSKKGKNKLRSSQVSLSDAV